ncbi:DUF485 domain-containing protein [Streptomyces sp. NPDC004647]|uniref:DUF485 domain-containing protein n=1 Tax=Streptomyces sp. NPDC004647 TaxID=3154671 RepID=UPI0033A23C82
MPSNAPSQPHSFLPPRPQAPQSPQTRSATGDLRRLRSAYRLLRRSMTLTALGYLVLFLLLSGFAPDVMDTELFLGLNLGLLMGLLQLPVALLAVIAYERLAQRNVDPLAHGVRAAAAQQDDTVEGRGW